MIPLSSRYSAQPADRGLYRGDREHDACGLAMVATLGGVPRHDVVDRALGALRRLEHRGAVGADPDTGDGAGIMTEIPDAFLCGVLDTELPAPGRYAAGLCFLPVDAAERATVKQLVDTYAAAEGLEVLAWRAVPTDPSTLGESARSVMPCIEQLVVAGRAGEEHLALDRRAYALRRRVELVSSAYFPSLSSRTIVHKGMLTTEQLIRFYPDLHDPRFATRVAIVHQRFSTNTFPAWPLAQPFRTLAHNGEINTVRGNRNRMRAAEGALRTGVFGDDLARLLPVTSEGASDSASLDEVLELLHLSGRSLPHALMMMVPPPWENDDRLDPDVRAFHQFHSMLIEPWDGPAAITFTDGSVAGATLDRNGLRPARWWRTDDGLVVLGSEAGLVDLPPARIVGKGRVVPGEFFLIDLDAGRIVPDAEVRGEIVGAHPYRQWVQENTVHLRDLPRREPVRHTAGSVLRRQRTFGYTEEELRLLIAPMAAHGAEPIGAMGSDTPVAVLSDRPRLLFDYFVQAFAQVTNPPLDAIRERSVTSLSIAMGHARNLLDATPAHARQLVLDSPVLTADELASIMAIDADPVTADFRTVRLRGLFPAAAGEAGLRRRLDELCDEAVRAIDDGATMLVLSDRDSDAHLAPIPSLLAVSAVHHHLVRARRRTRAALIAESGDAREVHHIALLVAYGASAVAPYLALETVEDLVARGVLNDIGVDDARRNLAGALATGLLKIMSKMGISTVASYRGAQTVEALGLDRAVVDEFFTGTTTAIDGIGLDVIAAEAVARHAEAYPPSGEGPPHRRLAVGGEYQWRREGEIHLFDPDTVFRLQHSTRARRYDEFRRYTDLVDAHDERLHTLRGLLRLRPAPDGPIPIDEVESVASILTRFMTGAMSYGSISQEAHETLAIAMNRIGGMSNSGEGGEDPERLRDPARSSAIKQIASGRFGVTSEYLSSARDLQIKIAQGAKPGEGGQLPGPKMYPWIARTRHATPGIGLISPPPHHDIYSIEDLAQLIHDLKNANPTARVHVKLVAEAGIGTVATGVAKAHADVVLVSGHDGGTGASPLNSLKHAGLPWELGLAETQQTLLLNGLRDRITVQVDGQLRTGRDVVIAALLGAEEYGFATAPLVVSGCIMMRVCHLDTCPVGVATQNPELRARFSGTPEFVVTFFEFIAEQVREHLAAVGLRSLDEAIGRVDLLETDDARRHLKQQGLTLDPVLFEPAGDPAARRRRRGQDHGLERTVDARVLADALPVLETGRPGTVRCAVANVDRSIGTRLGHELTVRHGGDGLPDDTLTLELTGTAGQSLGAFVPPGLTISLTGDANDYVAKGLSGGVVALTPGPDAAFAAHENVIAGNTTAYGATSGRLFLAGTAGERFGVRNSGATLVVEGIGDHGCEYMTGGAVLVLGPTGTNFAAGMSGGTAFVLDLDEGRLSTLEHRTGSLLLRPVPGEHRGFVLDTLAEHVRRTGSRLAAALLADETALFDRLTEITPREFERVMTLRQASADAGLDPDSHDVWNQILEGSHG